MARSYVNVRAQHGAETTPGTPVAATARFGAVSATLTPTASREAIRPAGQRFASTLYTQQEWSEGSIEGVPSYTEIGALLDWAYGVGASDGDDTVWTIGAGTTKTLEFGDQVQAAQVPGCFLTGLSLGWGRNSGEATVSGDIVGGKWNDGHTLTSGTTVPAPAPIEASQVCVFVDDTSGTLGTTQLVDAISVSIDLSDLRAADWRLDCTKPSISGSVETAPTGEIELLVEATAAGRAFLTDLRTGATRYLRVRATGADDILTLDFAVQVSNTDRVDEENVYASTVTLTIVEDANGFSHEARLAPVPAPEPDPEPGE